MLFHGDALTTLARLPDECVQMCITSPPYYGLRDYGTAEWIGGDPECDHMHKSGGIKSSTLGAASGGNDMSPEARVRSITKSFVPYKDSCKKCNAVRVDTQVGLEESPNAYIDSLVSVFREVYRVLRSDGTLWLNIGDTYAANRTYQVHESKGIKEHTYSHGARIPQGLKPKDLIGIPWRLAFALQDDGWFLRSDIIWSKRNAMPESAKDRPGRAHEYIFLLSKENKYYYDHEAVKVDAAWDRWGKQTTKKRDPMARGSAMVKDATKEEVQAAGKNKRNCRTVWDIPNRPYKGAHFAVFPEALVEIPIKAGSAVGDIVLDPFIGAGTTAVVATRLGRETIGIDLNSDYCDMTVERLTNDSAT